MPMWRRGLPMWSRDVPVWSWDLPMWSRDSVPAASRGKDPMMRTFAILLLFVTTAACEREQRRFSEASPASGAPQTLKMGQLEAGGSPQQVRMESEYEENAWAISEGQRYYEWFNCVGCHAHG